MSRIDELKKQYPELNITIMDILCKFDGTKSYKYLPLLCKILGGRFTTKRYHSLMERTQIEFETKSNLVQWGISTDNLTINQMFAMNMILDYVNKNDVDTFQTFKEYMEKGLIENKDVTSYKSIEEIAGVISLASIKEYEKSLETQIIKIYEDDTWLVIRPLTFSASSKYGAGTKWCTTYQKEKQYFEKYWRNGILVYFLNKKTGYKFAGFKEISNGSELSFWNSADSRVDYLDIEIDDYMFPIIKKTFKSEETNKQLSSDDIQEQVHQECIDQYDYKEELRVIPVGYTPEVVSRMAEEIADEIDAEAVNRLREFASQYNGEIPTMRG